MDKFLTTIPVVFIDETQQRVKILIVPIKVCAECGRRKPVRKLGKRFLCSECRESFLEGKRGRSKDS